jgi:hypothetical protein
MFRAALAPFRQAGWPDDLFLPGIPVGAALTPDSTVPEGNIGKVPGRLTRRGWVGMTGDWPSRGLGAAVPAVSLAQAEDWPTGQVCIWAGQLPALDCDADDERVAEIALHLARWIWGQDMPLRTRARSDRWLAPLHPMEQLQGFTRLVVERDGQRSTIEWKGIGHWVAAGAHPKGGRYGWGMWGVEEPPAWEEIPTTTQAQLDAFRERLEAALVDEGYAVRVAGAGAATSGPQAGARRALRDLPQLLSDATLERLLGAMECSTEVLGASHDEAVQTLTMLAGVLGRGGVGEDGRPQLPAVIEAWVMGYPGDDPVAWTDERWRSFGEVVPRPGPFVGWVESQAECGVLAPELADEVAAEVRGNEAAAEFAPEPDQAGGERPASREEAAAAAELEAEEAAAGAEEARQQRLQGLAAELVYWPEERVWFVRDTGEKLTAEALNVHPRFCGRVAPASAPRSRSTAMRLLQAQACDTVLGETWQPGQGDIAMVRMRGVMRPAFNRWRPGPVERWAEEARQLDEAAVSRLEREIRPWLDHVERVFDKRVDREHFLNFIAFRLQQPAGKVNHSIMVRSRQGLGKDMMLRPVAVALGPWNYKEVSTERLQGRFTDWIEAQLILGQEVAGEGKFELYNRLKAVLASTAGGTVTVERKGRDPYESAACQMTIFFTNAPAALGLSTDDRRLYVVRSDWTPPADTKAEAAYFDALAAFYDGPAGDGAGCKAVAMWLLRRDLAAFNPYERPAMTEAKLELIEEAQGGFAAWLRDITAPEGSLGERKLLTTRDVLQVAASDFADPMLPDAERRALTETRVGRALGDQGWRQRRIRACGKLHRLWARMEGPGALPGDYMDRDGAVWAQDYRAEQAGMVPADGDETVVPFKREKVD